MFLRRNSFIGLVGAFLCGFFADSATAGLVINPIFDSSITSDPNGATIMSSINSAIAVYQSRFSDPITVTINFQKTTSGLGASSTYYGNLSYTSYRNLLVADASTANDSTALSFLSAGANNPVNGNSSVNVTTANLRALGVVANPPSGQPDSFIYLNTGQMNLDRLTINPSKYDLIAVVSHEIDEALGFGSALNGLGNGSPTPTGPVWGLDLYRYDQTGVRSFNTSSASQAYFSINGTTQLSRFNQTAGGDFSDWFSISAHTPQVQDAFGAPGAVLNLGNAELTGLDVLGYNLLPVPEPGTASLLALGILGLFVRRLKRR
jgi:hypothetical protein